MISVGREYGNHEYLRVARAIYGDLNGHGAERGGERLPGGEVFHLNCDDVVAASRPRPERYTTRRLQPVTPTYYTTW